MARDAACQLLKENQEGGKQTVKRFSCQHVVWRNDRIRLYYCQKLVSLWLIVLMKVKCVTVVMLVVEDMKHSAISVTH